MAVVSPLTIFSASSRVQSGVNRSMPVVLAVAKQEEFDYAGRRFQLEGVRVQPRPVQRGGPELWIAAMSEAGARRAARRGAHLLPQGDRAAVLDPYFDQLGREGPAAVSPRVGIVRPFVVTEDPAMRAAFQGRTGAFAQESYITDKYKERFSQIDDAMTRQLDAGEQSGRTIPQSLFAGDPEECIRELEWFSAEFGVTDVILAGFGTSGGDDPRPSTDNLERFAREVMPHFAD